ncbi:hypothetical protein EDD86DRAFT_277503 [Gorgonomyces haynaldii]|nr:hypothetical protein EDD86DRAFT_277503 [Gorgonomyces haynaldii]
MSLLLSVCDWHINYVGCPNYASFIFADTIYTGMYSGTAFLYFLYLALRFIKCGLIEKKRVRDFWNPTDFVGLMALMTAVCRIALHANGRTLADLVMFYGSREAIPTNRLVLWFRGNLYSDHLQLVTGGLAMSGLVNSVVTTATGASLYEPVKVGERIIDPSKALKIIRLTVLILGLVFVNLFAFNGIFEKPAFVFYRRLLFSFTSFVSLFISLPILWFFGSKVIITLRNAPSITGSKSQQKSMVGTKSQTPRGRTKTQVGLKSGFQGLINKDKDPEKIREKRLQALRAGATIMYAYVGIQLILYSSLNEIYEGSPEQQLLIKWIIDAGYWVFCTWFVYFLFTRI